MVTSPPDWLPIAAVVTMFFVLAVDLAVWACVFGGDAVHSARIREERRRKGGEL